MRDYWFTSDTHFGDKELYLKQKENFTCVEERDELLIQNWNKVVKPKDKVYHLGDVIMGDLSRAKGLFSRLNGKKRLVFGNHDNPHYLNQYFKKTYSTRKIKEWGILLSHIPLHPTSLGQLKNIHGHTHLEGSPEGNYRTVTPELNHYTPVHLEEL